MLFKKRGVRGQITVFIILGIIILFAVGLILYLKEEVTIFGTAGFFSTKTTPISRYIETCLGDVAEDGLVLIGEQGGYLNIPESVRRNRKAAIWLDPKGLAVVPLWFYKGQDRTPSFEVISAQLEAYVKQNLPVCLDNLEDFRDEFSINQLQDLEIDVKIGRSDVAFQADYNLRVYSQDRTVSSVDIGRSRAVIGLSLRRMYDLAREIAVTEKSDMFLERITIDLMAMNPKIPFTGMEFRCGSLMWDLRDIKQEVQDMMTAMAPEIRFRETDHMPFLEPVEVYEDLRQYKMQDFYDRNFPDSGLPRDAYSYNHFLINVSQSQYKDLNAMVIYRPEWDMDIYARPSSRGILKSGSMSGPAKYLRFLCINIYHFTYDVLFPVQIVIHDPDALHGKGYNFRFALPVTINHNEGDKSDFGINVFDIPATEEAACEPGERQVDIRVTGLQPGPGGGIANMELKDVDIFYNCIKFGCPLGQTKQDGGMYRLVTNLPDGCLNGFLIAEKEGYQENEVQLGPDDIVYISIDKLKTMDVKAKKHVSTNIGMPIDLKSDEQVLISIEDNSTFGDYAVFTRDGENITLDLFEEGRTYFLHVLLMDSGDTLLGGYMANWTVRYEELVGRDEIVFHVYEQVPAPQDDEDIYNLIDYISTNATLHETLRPEIR
ncbi:hypothetical protein JW968_03540 [Candidatus Woesearchaeota archaeon]|nr:hypothetical protein [Candidatus Woesearchaeota archaeon]